MTRPGIEPQSPGPLANTRPKERFIYALSYHLYSQNGEQNTPTASLEGSNTPQPRTKCPGYDTNLLWEMRSTPSLPLLPDPRWPGMVAPDRVLSIS